MDLKPIGKHCEHCNELDLLPIFCSYCKRTFCRHHAPLSEHACPNPPATAISSVSKTNQPLGPRCQLASCSNPSLRTWSLVDNASAPGSGEKDEGEEVLCTGCGLGFCLTHRGPSAHACSPPAKTLTPAQAHTRALIANLSSSSTSPASTRKPAVAHKKPINPAIALMKLKQTAKPGRGDVARPERWHLVIGVDLDWKKQGEGEGEATFWKKDLTVGQVIQALETRHSVVSRSAAAGNPSNVRSSGPFETHMHRGPSLMMTTTCLAHQTIHLVHHGSTAPHGALRSLARGARLDACGVEDGGKVTLVRGDGWQRE